MNYNFSGMAPRIALIPTRGIESVVNFPVVPGAPVYFIDETAPFIYVKTAGVPPFGKVTIETFRVTKEEAPAAPEKTPDASAAEPVDTTKSEISGIWAAIDEIRNKLNGGEKHESANEAEG